MFHVPLFVVDDDEDHCILVRESLGSTASKLVFDQAGFSFVLAPEFPERVYNSRTFQSALDRARSHVGAAVVFLDLQLFQEGLAELDRYCLALDAEEQNRLADFWRFASTHGLLIGREFVRNGKARPLVLCLVTVSREQGERQDYLEYVKTHSSDVNQIIVDSLGRSIKTAAIADKAIATAVAAINPMLRARRLSDLDVEDWRTLRACLIDFASSKQPHRDPDWTHHAAHGGSLDHLRCDDFAASIAAARTLHLAVDLKRHPLCSWHGTDLEGTPAYELAPIRALMQYDSLSCDLSAALHLLGIKHASRADLRVDMRVSSKGALPKWPLPHDYLWFNYAAICSGLDKLTTSFCHELEKEKQRCEGRVGSVSAEETIAIEETKGGVEIKVEQHFVKWYGGDETVVRGKHQWRFPEASCVRRAIHALPHYEAAQKHVLEAYDCFRRAGAQLQFSEGALVMRIAAKTLAIGKTKKKVWEVSDGA